MNVFYLALWINTVEVQPLMACVGLEMQRGEASRSNTAAAASARARTFNSSRGRLNIIWRAFDGEIKGENGCLEA